MTGLSPGSVLAGFQVERQIGAGGMGAVYLATDTTLDRAVALKVVAPDLAGDARYRERFLVEARLAASLEHPAIVPVYAAGEADGELFLAMPFMRGGSLADRIGDAGRLPVSDALGLLGPIADALDTAHAAGLVHRDVKPGNVLLQADRAYLADFGLARPVATVESLHSRCAAALSGTIGYLAPEQLEGDRVDARTDQYALACLIFECLAGHPPYRGDNDLAVVYAHLSSPPPSLTAARPELPRAVDAVIARGLAKRPDDRFDSCRALVEAISAASGVAAPPAPMRASRRRRLAALGGVLAVAGAAAVGGILVAGRGGGARSVNAVAAPLDPVVVVNPVTGRIVARLRAGTAPSAIAVGAGAVWVLNRDDRTIARLDPKTQVVRTIAVASGVPYGIAVGAGALWVSTRASKSEGNAAGTVAYPDGVTRIDLKTLSPVDAITLPRQSGGVFGPGVQEVAAGAGAVWAVDPDGTVARIDPASDQAEVIAGITSAWSVATGDGYAWAIGDREGALNGWRIDPATRAVTAFSIDTDYAGNFTVGDGALWFPGPTGYLLRVDPGPPVRTKGVAIPQNSAYAAYDAGRLWVASLRGGSLLEVDPHTVKIRRTIPLDTTPQAIAAGAGGVWIASLGRLQSATAAGVAPRGGDIPIGTCDPVVGPRGARPDVLIASDQPLIGPEAVLGQPIADAVRFEVERRGFRAGRFTVGYQSCDDGAPEGDVAIDKCLANARAYAATPRLLGVVGAFHSFCTRGELSFLSPAPGGPVATISAHSSGPDLTSELSVYNGGPPDFARVIVTDYAWVQAGVQLADSLGVRHLFLLGAHPDDLTPLTDYAAATEHTSFAGSASFGRRTAGFSRIVSQIAATHADGVYLMAPPDAATGTMIRLLRQHLGRRVRLIATDTLVPVPTLLRYAGAAATGMYIVTYTPPYAALGDAGRAWLKRFAAAERGRGVSAWAPLAAEATDVLLDAIARSNGTRASVTRNMLATSKRDSILGAFHFEDGDIRPARVSVLRVIGGPVGASPTYQPDYDGAVLDRVITVGS